jgi:hypothetical protein
VLTVGVSKYRDRDECKARAARRGYQRQRRFARSASSIAKSITACSGSGLKKSFAAPASVKGAESIKGFAYSRLLCNHKSRLLIFLIKKISSYEELKDFYLTKSIIESI